MGFQRIPLPSVKSTMCEILFLLTVPYSKICLFGVYNVFTRCGLASLIPTPEITVLFCTKKISGPRCTCHEPAVFSVVCVNQLDD